MVGLKELYNKEYIMSLDVSLIMRQPTEVFSANITHNLTEMAEAAGIYYHLWRPEEIGITKAEELISPLMKALVDMKKRPDFYKKFNPPNGWGSYDTFVPWIEEYLKACILNPSANIEVWR